MSNNTKLAERLRAACATVRTKSMPLADLIPLMQQAADKLAAHDAEQAALRDLECPPDPETVERELAAQAVPQWHPVSEPLAFMTRCSDGTTFLNCAKLPAHAVEWAIANPPAAPQVAEKEPE